MNTIKCLHCGEQVVAATGEAVGTYWTHAETWQIECRPTYAAPDFSAGWTLARREREGGQ